MSPRSFWITPVLACLLAGGCSKGHIQGDLTGQPTARTTAFTNVRLIPMTGEKVVEGQTVLVGEGRIVAVGPSDRVSIPWGSEVIDGAGTAYLMPGLADMHVHTREDWYAWRVPPPLLYLAHGVTTIRDMGPKGDPPTYVLQWRTEIQEGNRVGPTMYAAGPIVYGLESDAKGTVQARKAAGFDFLKLYSFFSAEQFREAMGTAKQVGFYVTGHIPFPVGLEGVLSEGMDEIAHIEELTTDFIDFDRSRRFPPRDWYAYIARQAYGQYGQYADFPTERLDREFGNRPSDTARRISEKQVRVCTTLVVDQVIVRKLVDRETFLSSPEARYLPREYVEALRAGREKHIEQFRGIEEFASLKYRIDQLLLRKLKENGTQLLLGTDSGGGEMGIAPGFSVHDELRILTQNGFTPYEALLTATVHASKAAGAFGRQDGFGTVEVGRRADLLLLGGNPLEDLRHVRRPLGVMAAGRWYPRGALDRMLALR